MIQRKKERKNKKDMSGYSQSYITSDVCGCLSNGQAEFSQHTSSPSKYGSKITGFTTAYCQYSEITFKVHF